VASPIESLLARYSPKTAQDYENALKEIIQEITLAGLSRTNFFDKAAFYGGTALRIFYGLPRFSEDLDFTLLKRQPDFKLNSYFKAVEDLLTSFDFEVHIESVEKDEDRAIESAFLRANTQIHLLKIESAKPFIRNISHNKAMSVKFEVDVLPPLGFKTEVKILLPPVTASVKVLKPESLFAGKMHAILFRKWKKRIKGRDFYDLLWYLGQGISIDLNYLETKMREGGTFEKNEKLLPTHVQKLLNERIKSINWDNAKQDVMKFLRDPQEVAAWSESLFLEAAKRIKFS